MDALDAWEREMSMRADIAVALDEAGYPSVAADIREGVEIDVVAERVREVMTDDDGADALEILAMAKVHENDGYY